jgi:hypothetical protein
MYFVYYVSILFASFLNKYLNLEIYIIQFAKHTQDMCLKQTPHITHDEIWKSMICGEPLMSHAWAELLTQVGLVHIIVVSGAHLILIDKFLKLLKIPNFLTYFLEIVYCFFTGLQAPVVRAFLYQIRTSNIKSSVRIIFVIQIALCIFPSWIDSISFQMSICACLALNMIELNKSKISILLYPIIIQIYLFPFLKNFSLIAIFTNVFIAPIYEVLLLTLGFLSFFLPLSMLFDIVAENLFVVCKNLNLNTFSKLQNFDFQSHWVWIFLLIAANWRYQIFLLRKKAVKN